MRKLGELGCSPDEARARLKRLIVPLKDVPLTGNAKQFVADMSDALTCNPDFAPSPGQVFYAQDLYDRLVT